MNEPTVVALHTKLARGEMLSVGELQVLAGRGFVNDHYFDDPRGRQCLLLSTDTLYEFGYDAGTLIEQVTLSLKGLQGLTDGTVVHIGSVPFELATECRPCSGMAGRLGEEPEEFKARLAGKRGRFAKALANGVIRVGDPVRVSTAAVEERV
ncbi:MAG: hypothetical protein HY248_00225 [Fimbriimonas ginsengisoli]|nr:hypothetical protein [Fimbriimonas ginsengisoli]